MTAVIKNLKLALPPGGDRACAVDGVSFELSAGKILCVVGESGSGKSMCAHALMGLLPETVTAESGEILFEGKNLVSLSPFEWLALRGRGIALVFQEPMTALNPLMRIRDLQRRRNMAVMFITHDFGVVAEIADRVVVLQHGKVVEQGTADDVLLRAQHPYTRALLAAVPTLQPPQRTPLLDRSKAVEVIGLGKTYVSGGGWFRAERRVQAAKEVSFDIFRGETLGLVGESGSGKSSVARLVMRLIEPDAGTVRIGAVDLTRIKGKALREQRRRIQMVFQDPFASLNPRRKVGNIITDGPIAHGVDPAAARKRAGELLSLVGLNAGAMERFPHEFSGGQRQRIGIARALALDPEILVADEAISALDVSVQAQVLDLLEDLKARLGLSMLFITHDLRVAAQICDRIAVMQHGAVVELKSASLLFAAPEHAYTRELLSAVPGQTSSSKAA